MADATKSKSIVSEKDKQSVIERLWLTFFNDSLYSKGIISEEQHNKMRLKIQSQSSMPS